MNEVKVRRLNGVGRVLLIGCMAIIALCVLAAVAHAAWVNQLRNIETSTPNVNSSGAMQKWIR